ncbi:hypothetical protein GQ53DRAFT_826393 [Thozetella sp. PMI_491]|nr:hypothetical protein GQ53DRAFT_826393 [Thozetella sp. PMI_491]
MSHILTPKKPLDTFRQYGFHSLYDGWDLDGRKPVHPVPGSAEYKDYLTAFVKFRTGRFTEYTPGCRFYENPFNMKTIHYLWIVQRRQLRSYAVWRWNQYRGTNSDGSTRVHIFPHWHDILSAAFLAIGIDIETQGAQAKLAKLAESGDLRTSQGDMTHIRGVSTDIHLPATVVAYVYRLLRYSRVGPPDDWVSGFIILAQYHSRLRTVKGSGKANVTESQNNYVDLYGGTNRLGRKPSEPGIHQCCIVRDEHLGLEVTKLAALRDTSAVQEGPSASDNYRKVWQAITSETQPNEDVDDIGDDEDAAETNATGYLSDRLNQPIPVINETQVDELVEILAPRFT